MTGRREAERKETREFGDGESVGVAGKVYTRKPLHDVESETCPGVR